MSDANGCAENTDREIWRERDGDYYADSIHVTEGGGIGINCGGTVIVKPVREWHRLATPALEAPKADEQIITIEHDGFRGTIIGRYVTREGKRGVVLQQDGTKVVHVYGEKWIPDALHVTPALEARPGEDEPCGECHLQLGEVCDICGRRSTIARPKGSNADEWQLFLTDHPGANAFLAVQIAEAIEAARASSPDAQSVSGGLPASLANGDRSTATTSNLPVPEWDKDGFGKEERALFIGGLYVGHVMQGVERQNYRWRGWFMHDDEGEETGWFDTKRQAQESVEQALRVALTVPGTPVVTAPSNEAVSEADSLSPHPDAERIRREALEEAANKLEAMAKCAINDDRKSAFKNSAKAIRSLQSPAPQEKA